jgi:hypothetical protein
MAERFELASMPKGGEHTQSTDDVKKAAWDLTETLGVKDEASMSYSPKTGMFIMTLSDAVEPAALESFRTGTDKFRTEEAKAELAANLPAIKAEFAAGKEAKAAEPAKEKPVKEPALPRSDIAIFPLPVEASAIREGQTPEKAMGFAMLTEANAIIDDMGLKGTVKYSFDKQNDNHRFGGNGLSEETVKSVESALAKYRTPEAEAAWREAGPARVETRAAAAAISGKGPVEAEAPAPAKGGAER